MEVVICLCDEKPTIMTDSPLVEHVVSYAICNGYDTTNRDGNAVRTSKEGQWAAAYYSEDLTAAPRNDT